MRRSAFSPSKPMKSRGAPLKAKGARAKRVAEDLDASREAAFARAGGRCEWCKRRTFDLDAHHIVPRSRGAGWPRLNAPGSLAALCRFPCHERVTLDPLAIVEAPGELGARASLVWHEFQAWRAGANHA